MKIVFIAGPLTTGWDKKDKNFVLYNIKKAESFQKALASHNIGFYCPHIHTSSRWDDDISNDEFYKTMNKRFLTDVSDSVLAMPGWEESRGAKDEVDYAIENNIPIFYPKFPDDINDIIVWAKEK
ncbi:MAG: DUF4406 domain-containing protein [Patescibacteria group bacterium]|nr:DUF4406 domain-containing protein [Patescibacteria group bacterium]MDD4304411.1 DUF4406 domain-containing protein [Patescibacteria group bacterium]MDD4695434.1 DUF4406 domain-containing protein [Patescibacteria group bacterium]